MTRRGTLTAKIWNNGAIVMCREIWPLTGVVGDCAAEPHLQHPVFSEIAAEKRELNNSVGWVEG